MTVRVRAGAIAAAALCLFASIGLSAAGAQGEDASAADAPLASAAPALPAEGPRFISQEIVQPLPEAAPAASAGSLSELVAAMPAETDLSRDLLCLAQGIYFEARGEPLHGQLAVGQVIVNRAASGLFPGDYCSVITQRGQFSFVRGGRIPAVNETSVAWSRARALAQIAHRELWESEAGDALFFHATYVRPGWARGKIARATIDRHVFYR